MQGDLGRDAGRRFLRELEADGGWDAVYALHSGVLEPSPLVRQPALSVAVPVTSVEHGS
jgi:hypothetical protein